MPRLLAMETVALLLWFGLGSFGLISFGLRSNLTLGFELRLPLSHSTLSLALLN